MAGEDAPEIGDYVNSDTDVNDVIPHDDNVNNDMEELMNHNYGRSSGRFELRPQNPRGYSHFFTTKNDAQQNHQRQC